MVQSTLPFIKKSPYNARHEEETGLSQQNQGHPLVIRDHLTRFLSKFRYITIKWNVIRITDLDLDK